jgi:hypothetical protein
MLPVCPVRLIGEDATMPVCSPDFEIGPESPDASALAFHKLQVARMDDDRPNYTGLVIRHLAIARQPKLSWSY